MTREEINKEKQKKILKEQNQENIKNIIKTIIKISITSVLIILIFLSYTTYISTSKISVREYRITNKKIPNSFNGAKILHLSDLHFGSTMNRDNLDTIKKIVNQRKPDIIVYTGDLINKDYKINSEDTEILTKKLKELEASLGKYAILGDEDTDKISTIFNQADFTILKNESDLIYKNNNSPILIVGLSSLINNQQDIEAGYSYFKLDNHNSNIFTVTLVHEPDSSDDIINNYNPDLILSGHSHNGNIRLPFVKYSIFKKNGAKKYDQDYYKIKKTKLFISGGLGTNNSSGIRLFCRPSINLYRLSN